MAEQDPAGSEPAAPKRRGRKPWPDHVKKSGKFVPPLLALDGLSLSNFRKDALPDLLWLGMSLLAWPVAGGSAPTIRALDIAQEEVDADVGTDSKDSIVIDGSLVAFERVPEPARERILDRLEAEGIYEDVVPKPVAHALGLYDAAPGRWLASRWFSRGLVPIVDDAVDPLTQVVINAQTTKSDLATDMMFLWLRSWAKAGRIILSNSADSGTSDVPDLLVGYPNRLSEDDLGAARATVRAMFGGMYAPICAAERRLAYRALRDRERRGADSDRDRSVRSSRKLGLPDRGLGRTLAVVKTPAANPSLDGPTSTCKDPS